MMNLPPEFALSVWLALIDARPESKLPKCSVNNFLFFSGVIILQNRESSLDLGEERPSQESLIPIKAHHP